jgi:predicted O-methyltransferase YrrM
VNPYDRVRYPSMTFGIIHPAALGVFAALFGRPFAPFDASRTLEIGCGEGVNLINMALGAPKAEFVGVDLSEDAITRARATARSCGCSNISFHVLDLAEVDAGFGEFDYVQAHGVYAWVPPAAREAIFRVIGERLSRRGLAVVSYNVLPGARLRQAIRDMLLHVTKEIDDPREKIERARSFIADEIEAWADGEADESAVKSEARRILEHPPGILYHDELSEHYAPQMLSDVVAAARRFGLDYLADAQPGMSQEALFPSDALAAMHERARGDWVRFEQFGDFRTLRRFRYSIFGHRGAIDRRREAGRLLGLWASGELSVLRGDVQAGEGAEFEAHGTRLQTNDPGLADFLLGLAALFPLASPLDAVAGNPALADRVLHLWVRKAIELRTAPLQMVQAPGERPTVNVLARVQAANGDARLATLRHTTVQIDDPVVRALVPLMDGAMTRGELAGELARRLELPIDAAARHLDEMLAYFARAGLMAG